MWTSVKREGFPEKQGVFVDQVTEFESETVVRVPDPYCTVEPIPVSIIEQRFVCAKQMKWSGKTEI